MDDEIKQIPKLNLDTSNLRTKAPSDMNSDEKEEGCFEQMIGQIGNAIEVAKMDMESPLTELRRAFDMLQKSSFFVDQNDVEEELPQTNDSTQQLGTYLDSLKLSETTIPVTNRSSRLQLRRPASLCIQDSAKEQHVFIRTPSVPPTTLTFPSSTGSPTGMEANSALLPFYLDPRNSSIRRSASNGLRIYSTDSSGKEQDVQWASSPHVHFSDWSNNNNNNNKDDGRSSPAFENPFCFEDSYAASSCYDSISRRSSTMQSEVSSSISIESNDDILTAPPILGREWHRGGQQQQKDSLYLDVKSSKKPHLPRLTPHINALSSSSSSSFNNNKQRTTMNRGMNRGGMRSASATASSTFKNAIRSIKRTTSFYENGKSTKRKESAATNEDREEENAQNAKLYGLALTSCSSSSQKSTKKEAGNRKHPHKSPYPPILSRMPSPSPSSPSPSVSFHFQSPMMASYFATLG